MMSWATTSMKCSGCEEGRELDELKIVEAQVLEGNQYEMRQQALCGYCYFIARWESEYYGYAFWPLALA
jgi:hypothetical protein